MWVCGMEREDMVCVSGEGGDAASRLSCAGEDVSKRLSLCESASDCGVEPPASAAEAGADPSSSQIWQLAAQASEEPRAAR